MRPYKVLLTYLALSVSLHARDNNIPPSISTANVTPLLSLPEDDAMFVPTEADSKELYQKQDLILDHRRTQSFDDKKIEKKIGLSLDGGGFRGYMEALWLQQLKYSLEGLKEDSYEGPFSKVFDYIGGTSIGGLLGLGVANDLDPDTLVNLFENHGQSIFPNQGYYVKLKNLWGLRGCRYDATPLENLLKDSSNFGNALMGDVATKVLVTACTTTGKPKLFKSSAPEDQKHKLWEVARCTSAAPTYFSAYQLNTYQDAKDNLFLDGGIWNNNPSTFVVTSMVKELHDGNFHPKNLYMLSLGTGDMSAHASLKRDSGYINAGDIIDLLMSSNSRGTHEAMQSLLGNTYYRVDPLLTQKIDLAATDAETIRILKASAKQDLAINVIKDFAEEIGKIYRDREK